MLGAGRSFCFLQHTQHALRVNGNAPAASWKSIPSRSRGSIACGSGEVDGARADRAALSPMNRHVRWKWPVDLMIDNLAGITKG